MANRYNSLDNTSPVLKSMQDEKPKISRSSFDFSNVTIGQLFLGAIIPIDLIRFVPNEDLEVSYDLNIISRNPLVRKLLSTQRCYVHTYIQYDRNMWEGARNQKTKGYSGNINLQVPCIELKKGNFSTSTPFSLSAWLGVPPMFYDKSNPLTSYKAIKDVTSSGISSVNSYSDKETFNALPFVMYQQICRGKFFNSNVLFENKHFYPDNQDHFILPYTVSSDNSVSLPLVNVLDYYNPYDENIANYNYGADGPVYVPENNSDTPVILDALHFRQRKGDRFSTALPFPDLIRGDIPYIDMTLVAKSLDDFVTPAAFLGDLRSTEEGFAEWSDAMPNYINKIIAEDVSSDSFSSVKTFMNLSQYHGGAIPSDELLKRAYGVNVQELASKIVASSLSLNDIRTLQAYTIFKERGALAKGDYNSLIEAQFGFNPSIQDREPIYVGGFYQDILFSEVTQSSQSTEDSQLGQKVCNAYSNTSGYIGKVKTRDYGYLMTLLSIVPDTYYTQGVSPEITQTLQEEVYFPILNELPPQAILNKELYTSGDSSVDNDVLAYTERYSEYKSRQNRVVGLSALGDLSEYDSALVQKQIFTETPVFNNSFLTLSPKNIDMSVYSVVDEPPYDFYSKSRIDRVAPFPYRAIPKGVI